MLIRELYDSGRPVISFEVFPPNKSVGEKTVRGAITRLSELSPDFISVTYSAGGTGSVSKTVEIASFAQDICGAPALAHLTCAGASREVIDGLLENTRKAGISNILALRGDLIDGASQGDFQYADQLIRHILSHGDFCVGAACYPEGHIDCENLDTDIYYLRQKQESGADFLITQLFFDNDAFFSFMERARRGGVTLHVSAGVMPILGRAQIERMIFMCGVSLPAGIIKLLHKYDHDPDSLRQAGIEHAARQMADLLARGAEGIHIYTMNKPEIAEFCVKHIGHGGFSGHAQG